jgi:hypothetical protein
MTEPPSEDSGRLTARLPTAIFPALIAFVGTGLLSPLYSGDDRSVALTLWQAVVLWPIGGILLGAPAWLLAYNVRDRLLFRSGQALLVIFAVWTMSATARSDDAQAGFNFFIIPWFGTIAIACLMAFQGIRHRWGRH